MRTRWRMGAVLVVIVTSLGSSLYAAAPLREFPYARQTNLTPGAYRFVFSLYSSPTAATPVWTSGTVPLTIKTPLLLYTLGNGTNKIPASIDFSQQLYVKVVKTYPAPSVVVANRERYAIVPYALSLRPGAAIKGNISGGAVLELNNSDSSTAGGYALSAVNYSGNTWRPAIYGENKGASAGVYGRSDGWHAVVGWSEANSWAGVYGHNAGSGYGVYADSTDGNAIHGVSTSGTGVYGQSDSGIAGDFNRTTTFTGIILQARNGSDIEFKVDDYGDVHADGTFMGGGADFAERIAPVGGKAVYEPGDVLVLAERATRSVELSSKAYSPRVAGIYSTRPALVGRPYEELEDERVKELIPMAITGIVPCKVTAGNGAIEVGDLLVTSSRPGFAMKGTKRSKMLGAVVGKAMEALPRGEGVILVLITLQ